MYLAIKSTRQKIKLFKQFLGCIASKPGYDHELYDYVRRALLRQQHILAELTNLNSLIKRI